jgi:diguanylate cyclase (GGDEF)-like protein
VPAYPDDPDFEHPDRPENGAAGSDGVAKKASEHADPSLDQTFADSDQTSSDRDQTLADSDQTSSDADQTSSDQDQRSARSDQVASDREQKAADQMYERLSDPESIEAHADATRVREMGTQARNVTSLRRAESEKERAEAASARDRNARERDRTSSARDRTAATRDDELRRAEEVLARKSPKLRAATWISAEARARAMEGRRRAAEDRRKAAEDRERARLDRIHARADLERAHIDDLTGAYRRGAGEVAISHEIDRSRRVGSSLVLAFVDVDGLKGINDRQGHAAGDTVLQNVVGAIRSNLRSYEPIVRLGGDEFLCTFSDTELPLAKERFARVSEILAADEHPSSVSVGYAELEAQDALVDLVKRADAALTMAKGQRNRANRPRPGSDGSD